MNFYFENNNQGAGDGDEDGSTSYQMCAGLAQWVRSWTMDQKVPGYKPQHHQVATIGFLSKACTHRYSDV